MGSRLRSSPTAAPSCGERTIRPGRGPSTRSSSGPDLLLLADVLEFHRVVGLPVLLERPLRRQVILVHEREQGGVHVGVGVALHVGSADAAEIESPFLRVLLRLHAGLVAYRT